MTNGNGGAASVAPPSPNWDYDGTKATEREVADLLAGFVRALKPEVVVETGTFFGTTAKRLSRALELNDYGHLYTIENDPAMAAAYAEMKLERTTFINGDSLDWAMIAPPGIHLAFVDCGEPDHRLDVAKELWPKIGGLGLLALHDTEFYPGLARNAIESFGEPSLVFLTVNGLMIWQKK